MLVPVRCFQCGNPFDDLWQQFQEKVKNGSKPDKALDDLKLKNICCRMNMIGHVNLIDKLIKYE